MAKLLHLLLSNARATPILSTRSTCLASKPNRVRAMRLKLCTSALASRNPICSLYLQTPLPTSRHNGRAKRRLGTSEKSGSDS
eukprot:621856-Pyramimonas_sp.AAC.1